jgi:hypothetical protein
MNAAAIAALLFKIAQAAPGLIKTAQDLIPVGQDLIKHIKDGTEPTADEWKAVHDKIDALTADIEAPIPE